MIQINQGVNYYKFVFLTVFAFFIETIFLSHISGYTNLLLIIIIAFGLSYNFSNDVLYFFAVPFLLGIFLDLYDYQYFGLFTFSFLFVSVVMALCRRYVCKDSGMVRLIISVCIAIVFYNLFVILWYTIFFSIYINALDVWMWKRLLLDILIASVLTLPVKYLISK